MVEEWKIVDDYPNYEVSNTGKVRNHINHAILRACVISTGYFAVTLYKDKKGKTVCIHRLVAKTFVKNENPEECIQVNHIDGNKLNNLVSNLEWVTAKGNKQHALSHGLIKKFGPQKTVAQFDVNGNLIATYPSATEASRIVGVSQGNISNVCRGYISTKPSGVKCRHITAGGYKWAYV